MACVVVHMSKLTYELSTDIAKTPETHYIKLLVHLKPPSKSLLNLVSSVYYLRTSLRAIRLVLSTNSPSHSLFLTEALRALQDQAFHIAFNVQQPHSQEKFESCVIKFLVQVEISSIYSLTLFFDWRK